MRKLMWLSVGFALACVVGMYFLQGRWYFLASGVAAALVAVCLWLMQRYSKIRVAAVLLFGCMIGFVWLSVFESVYLSVPRGVDNKRMILTLTATDYAQENDYGSVVQAKGNLNGKVYTMQVYLPKHTDISPGDTLTARYTLRSTLPGGSADSPYRTSGGTFLIAKAMRMPDIVETDSLPWTGYPAYVHQIVKQTITDSLPADVAGFAIALLIGDTDGIDYETDVSFRTSGISHIIAVSGFHVTALFGFVYMLAGKKRFLAAAIGLPVLFFFAAVAGFSPSIMRACIMHSLMVIAMLFNKEYDAPTALGFAVLLMLLMNPWAVTNVGFQLSVACMIGILLFAEPIKQWIMNRQFVSRRKGRWKKLAGGMAVSVGMSVGSTITVTPLCAYYFGVVSFVGVITNLLTLWVITAIFYCVLTVCLIGLIWMPVARILGWLVAWPIRYVLMTAKILSSLPISAVYTDSIYIVQWLIFVYILLILSLLLHKKLIRTTACCAVIALCLALTASWMPPRMDECKMTVLDVGQGQCILLQSQGKTFMVDCGGDYDTQTADIASNALLSQGIFSLDGLILTHYDADHAAGVAYLLSRIPADLIYLPNCNDAEGSIERILSVHDGLEILVDREVCITFDGTQITLIPSFNDLSDNESGLCVLFQRGNCDILITGDRSTAGERELMRHVDLPDLEVLIVGHHGSRYSTGYALLEKTRPEIAIISVGEDNLYGHPTDETLQRLREAGCVVYRTDLHGTVIYRG